MSKRKIQENHSNSSARPKWIENSILLSALLFVFACLLYANTLGHDFALDDAIVITENVITQKGPAAWGELFGNDTFYGFFQDRDKLNLVSGGRYRPLSLAMFGLEASIAQGPFIHHLFNLLWYGGLVSLLFMLLVKIQRHTMPTRKTYWFPLLATLLFAAHPIHTEVVANIKGRDEIMALIGCLAATWYCWKAVDEQKWSAAILGSICFFLALLSKENAITFIAVIPLLLYLFRKDFAWNQLRFFAPSAIASVLFLILRSSVLEGGVSSTPMELMNNPFIKFENGKWIAFSFAEWSATVVYGLGKYLQLLILPIQQSHDYYPRAFGMPSWSDIQLIIMFLLNVGLVVFGLLSLRKRPWLAAGILVYFGTLGLVANILFPVGTLVSERFLFFPSIGLALALGHFDYRSSKAIGDNKIVIGIVLLFVLLFSVKTVTRNNVWKDNYTLFTTDVQHEENSAKLQNAAAGAKVDRFISLPKAQQELPKNQRLLTEAMEHTTKALKIHPTYKQAYAIRGTAKVLAKQYEAAIKDFDFALELDPGFEDVMKKLLITYREAGKYYGEQKGDLNKSQRYLNKALQLDPKDYETLRLSGVLNGVSGRKEQAIAFFKKAADVRPDSADAWWNLGVAYYQNNQVETAEQNFAKARQLEPGIAERKRAGN